MGRPKPSHFHWAKSLRLQLLGWVVVPLAGLLAVNLWTSHNSAVATADLVTDRTLIGSARSIAEQVAVVDGVLDATVPPAAIEMFDTGSGDSVYYRVETSKGTLLTGYPDFPRPKRDNQRGTAAVYRQQRLRILTYSHPIVGAGAESPIRVTVGVTLAGHDAMVRKLWLDAFLQQLALVLIAGICALLGLRRGLAPLIKLRDAVRNRGRADLEPLSIPEVQNEIRPLVDALNEHMGRVRGQMAAQRRFVANASHQLRTPLALLSTQAAYALREAETEARVEALLALQASTRRLARLAEQLLTLSRAEPGSRRPRDDRISLMEAAREVLETHASIAIEKKVDLGLDGQEGVSVLGDGPMLREMLSNLVDNALRYTPAGGRVTVCVSQQGESASLKVTDSGPGIPAEERERVFERFYRLAGSEQQGSGLGLAIAREVAENAGGRIALSDSAGGGLTVTVILPLAGRQ